MLLSDYFTLATEGATIDGRAIKKAWLEEIADQYDPEVYTANINQDHRFWYGNLGQVHSVRLNQNKQGKTILEGRIRPNPLLMQLNAQGQKLFFSVEIHPKFADTGKAYLTGLAITDQPASLGTSQIQFKSDAAIYTETQDLKLDFASKPPARLEMNQTVETSLHSESRILDKIKSLLCLTSQNPEQDIKMNNNPEKIMVDKLSVFSESINDMTQKVDQLYQLNAKQWDQDKTHLSENPENPENPSDESHYEVTLDDLTEVLKRLNQVEFDISELNGENPSEFRADLHTGAYVEPVEYI